ncbi:MAG: head GIN domain-containing protein, partial [Bacteroidota bacterium]|nr:head GIN domain-containing protein [Bacteroidota bacterium]
MKKNLLILPILLLTITISKANAFYSEQETITRQVNDFNSILSKCSADIIFIQSNETKIEIVTNNFDPEKVITKVRDRLLTIDIKSNSNFNFMHNYSIKIYVYSPTIESVQLSGSGDFEAKNRISGENFELSIRGSGDFDANMDMQNITINVNGSGDVNLSGVKNNLAIKINGSGDAKIKNVNII